MEPEEARKKLANYCVLLEALQILMDDDYNQTVHNRPIPLGLLRLPRPTPNRRNDIPETFKELLNALAERRDRQQSFLKQILEQIRGIQETDERVFLQSEAYKQLLCTVIGDNIIKIKYYRKHLEKAVKEFMERFQHSILDKDLNETLENILLDIETSKTKSGTGKSYQNLQ
ncbi:hypothetical protein K4K57_001635 [Colletotrichum sp. SAR 10_99]|nr:hypothetical protein K4K57_001635 [Colletotrichum sp. SAR 10_99]